MSDMDSAVATMAEGATVEAPEVETPTAEVETPQVETPEVDTGAQPSGDEQQFRQEQPREQKTDARTLPKDVQQALKQLRGANPNIARTLNDSYFRDRAAFGDGGLFRDMDEARATKATLAAVGGHEGIAEMQKTIAAFQDIDDLMDRGDPEVLDTMIEASPEGFKRLVPAAMEKLRGMDQQAFNDTILPILAENLANAGLKEEILASIEELRAGAGENAQRRLASIARWIAGIDDQTSRMKSQRPDPRVSQYESREKESRQRDETYFRTNVGQGLMNYLNPRLGDELERMWDGYNLTEDAKKGLAQDVFNELEAMMGKNEAYKTQANALIRQRDYGKTLEYMKTRADIDLPVAAKAVWDRRYGFMKKPAAKPRAAAPQVGNQPPANGATPAATGKPIMLAAKPKMDDLDMTQERALDAYIAGKGIMRVGPLKGKLVQWKK